MTRWARPNPGCEHNGVLMMWVRLMGSASLVALPTGHWTSTTNWSQRERDDWIRALVTFRYPWTCAKLKTQIPTQILSTPINTRYSPQTPPQFWGTSLQLQTGQLVAELHQLRPPRVKVGWAKQTFSVCDCFLRSHNARTQQLHTGRHWHACTSRKAADARLQSTARDWTSSWTLMHFFRHSNHKLWNSVQHCRQTGDWEWEHCLDFTVVGFKTCSTFNCLKMRSAM